MQKLDYMIDTKRLVIKTEEMGKIALEERVINSKKLYEVLLPKTCRFEDIDINKDNSVFFLNRLDIYNKFAVLNMTVYQNMQLRTYHFIEQTGLLTDIYGLHIPEPEERSSVKGVNINIKGLECIITDPDMFKSLLENGNIKATDDVLRTYDLYEPKFDVIVGGKAKRK